MDDILPGRPTPMQISRVHTVLGSTMTPPFADGAEWIYLASGCFWGAEELYWQQDGVLTTAVGYQGGHTPNPTYQEVCSGQTGHAESVLVVFDPTDATVADLLRVFWENHDPTQVDRQGNDVGTQYRSAIFYTTEAQRDIAEHMREVYGKVLSDKGFGPISTEIAVAGPFYYAEEYHQQYLQKNPRGYRCHSLTGVRYPGL